MADRFGYGEIGLDIHPCRGCEDYDAPDGCKSNGGCGRTQTNADRIRSMTDEELAQWLDDISKACYYEGYTKETDEPQMSPYPTSPTKWVTWLKQEVGE